METNNNNSSNKRRIRIKPIENRIIKIIERNNFKVLRDKRTHRALDVSYTEDGLRNWAIDPVTSKSYYYNNTYLKHNGYFPTLVGDLTKSEDVYVEDFVPRNLYMELEDSIPKFTGKEPINPETGLVYRFGEIINLKNKSKDGRVPKEVWRYFRYLLDFQYFVKDMRLLQNFEFEIVDKALRMCYIPSYLYNKESKPSSSNG